MHLVKDIRGEDVEACTPIYYHSGELDVADHGGDHQREAALPHCALGVVNMFEGDWGI